MNGSNLGHFLWDPGPMNVTMRPPTRFKSLPVDPGRMNVTITPPSLLFLWQKLFSHNLSKPILGVACENSRLSAKRLGRLFSQFGAGRPGLESCDVSGEENHSLKIILCMILSTYLA